MELSRLLLRAAGMAVTTVALSLLVDAVRDVANGRGIHTDTQQIGQMLTGTFVGALVFFTTIDDVA